MSHSILPDRSQLFICFAHPAYQMAETFQKRDSGIRHTQTWTPAALNEANVIDILQENLERLWQGQTALHNQVV